MKNLPPSIPIDGKTTVEDAKILVAKAARVRDYNRIAIIDPSTQAIIKDRKALLVEQKAVLGAGEFMVKDLGP